MACARLPLNHFFIFFYFVFLLFKLVWADDVVQLGSVHASQIIFYFNISKVLERASHMQPICFKKNIYNKYSFALFRGPTQLKG